MNKKQIVGEAIVFIENNLYNSITACDVAKAVSYSYYHFHRYFSAVMGETIGSYIRSRRLTQAAWDLIHSDKKIIDIGFSLYFETAESFTRAFKDRYLMTPTQYRKNKIDVLIGNRQSAQKMDWTIITHAGLIPEIVSISPVNIMGISFKTTINSDETATMWKQFYNRIPTTLISNKRYGIFEANDTCNSESFSIDSETIIFIGVEVPEKYPIPNDMKAKRLCGGKYAKFVHKGRVDTLIQTYHYIWGVWFPKSGLELADHDDFECYTERFIDVNNEDSEIDIYFPII